METSGGFDLERDSMDLFRTIEKLRGAVGRSEKSPGWTRGWNRVGVGDEDAARCSRDGSAGGWAGSKCCDLKDGLAGKCQGSLSAVPTVGLCWYCHYFVLLETTGLYADAFLINKASSLANFCSALEALIFIVL